MAGKKKASAEQLKARRKFARIMKSGGFKKKKTKSAKKRSLQKTKSAKVNTKSNSKRIVASRKGSKRRRVSRGIRSMTRGRGKIGSFFKKGMVGDTTSALGASIVTGAITDRVIPQYSTYAQAGAEYMVGGVGGMIGAEVVKSIVGLPSILNGLNIFGGGTQQVEASL